MKKYMTVLLTLFLVLFATSAMAALSTDQTAVVTTVTTLITDVVTMAWGLVLLVLGGKAGIKVFKSFFRTATSG